MMCNVLSLVTILTLLSRRNVIASSAESVKYSEEERTCSNSGGEQTCTTNKHSGFDDDMLDEYQDEYPDEYQDEHDDYEYDNDDDEDDDVHEEYEQKSGCIDTDKRCYGWAELGECKANPNYMLHYCKKSCGTCDISDYDVGLEQEIDGDNAEGTKKVIAQSSEYLLNTVSKDRKYSIVLELCKNEHELCAFWASIGECEKNVSYMKRSCSLACRSCDFHLMESRCPLDPDADRALRPGELNKLFERLLTEDEYKDFGVVAESRPYRAPGDEGKREDELDYKIGPWVMTFDSFLTDAECDRLVEFGGEEGYERSTNVGAMKADGTHERNVDTSRTSKNAWCTKKCDADPVISGVTQRIANVTKIPEVNQEYLQLLRYEVGQYYRSHHDYIEYHAKRQTGVRVLTFFLYLNDVAEGGGTKFTDLDIVVMPKKGKAVLWPSVLDEDPGAREDNTHHEAMPVLDGIKYGANSWIHMNDFKGPWGSGCI